MIIVESGTMQLLDGFLARHPEYELMIRMNRFTATLRIEYHNGYDYMARWECSCAMNDISGAVRSLLEEATTELAKEAQ